MIGTANSLTGVLAPFELAINDGMDVAAAEINAAGGVDGRQIEIVHVDAKSDLNLSATAALEVIEKGADIVVPMCDADYGAPGARAANEKGILAITCAGAPGHRQADDRAAHVQHVHRLADGERGQRRVRLPRRRAGARAYFLCDRALEYTKVVCEAFKTRWKELGGEVAGEDTFLQSDTSIASQVTRLKNAAKPDFLVLASYPGGSPAIKEIRAAYDGPDRPLRRLLGHVLAQGDAPPLERLGRRRRLELRRRPTCRR